MDNILQANVIPSLCASHTIYNNTSISDTTKNSNVIGGYFNDGALCWLAKGPFLTILRHASKKIICFKNFSSLFDKDTFSEIVSCKVYSNLLLVGITTDVGKGLLCLFNYRICRTLKAIHIPYSITCMEVILEQGGATHSSKPFAANLRWFFGVVAVGTTHGHLYLIDLRLDDNNFFKKLAPSMIEVVPTVIRDIPQVRSEVNCQSAHLAFDLLDQCHEGSQFHYISPDDQIMKTYFSSKVEISSLFFEPRCTSLFVGLSFGQFHIVDLKELMLSYSSGTNEYVGPITNFVFQEPENDPKNFCYLWVVQNTETNSKSENTLHGSMYQMLFAKKELLRQEKNLRSLYTSLEVCNPRFHLSFNETFGLGPSMGISSILQSSAIERYNSNPRQGSDDDYSSTPATSVFVTTWLTNYNQRRTVHTLLFDINCWYVAQMPSACRGFSDDEIYVTLWSLNCVVDDNEDKLLATYVSPSSLHHFRSNSHPTPRQFTYPSSYSLKTHCLTTNKTMTCKMLGVQDQAIEYLLDSRSESLINPDYIFDQMATVGLTDILVGDVLSVNQKRDAILSAALNHDIFNYLSRVISDLSTGEHAASGCSLRFVLEWAWKHTAIIKDTIDSFCVPVFDCSVVRLDTISQELLSRKITQLDNLNLIFKKLKHAEVSSQLSLVELDVKHNVIHLIQDYLKILRWFIGARLLPEQLDDHLSFELNSYEEFHFIYKQKELRAIYEERRKEMKEINRSSESSLLIIDGLIDEAGKDLLAQWRKSEENSSAKYPPPSLYALLSMYYLETIDETLKHSIITYFLLDILAVAEESMKQSDVFEATYHEHRQTVTYFPQTFQIPPSRTKLIKAFWLLDHCQFQESCWTFCEPGTERVTQPWQHRRILQAYMTQAHADLALQYLVAHQPATSSVDDVKLHIDVLVKNRKLHHALNIAQMKGDPRHREVIYTHLFSSCYKQDLLPDLLNLTVSKDEESLVRKYFESSNIPHSQDILVLHLLRRCRYVEALQLYKKNKKITIMTKHDEIEKGYHATLNHIVQGYLNILPQPLKDFAHVPSDSLQRNNVIRKEVLPVCPLSSILNSSQKSAPLSQASLLSLNIGKPKRGISPPPITPFRQKPRSTNHDHSLNDSIRYFSTDLQSSEPRRRSSRKSFSSTSVSMKRTSLGGSTELSSLLPHKEKTSPITFMSVDGLEKKRSVLMKSASILLQTPPIQRSRRRSQTNSVTLSVHTPHSILKVRQFGEKTPQTSNASHRTLSDQGQNLLSGSNASLKDDVAGRLVFNDQGLDSSGSDCETPAWMVSSMSSQRKKWTTKSTTFLNSTFNIETPPVARKSGNYSKGKVGFSDTPRTIDSSSSTKRLRFRDLVCDRSPEKKEVVIKADVQVASVAGVLLQKTNEDIDVDIEGDVTDDVVQTSVRESVNQTLSNIASTTSPEALSKSKTVTDPHHTSLSGDVEDTSTFETRKEDVLSDDDVLSEEAAGDCIVLQLSDSSDHYEDTCPSNNHVTPAMPQVTAVEKVDDGDVLEISSDDEFSSPFSNKLEHSNVNLIPSQRSRDRFSAHTQLAPDPSGSVYLRENMSSDNKGFYFSESFNIVGSDPSCNVNQQEIMIPLDDSNQNISLCSEQLSNLSSEEDELFEPKLQLNEHLNQLVNLAAVDEVPEEPAAMNTMEEKFASDNRAEEPAAISKAEEEYAADDRVEEPVAISKAEEEFASDDRAEEHAAISKVEEEFTVDDRAEEPAVISKAEDKFATDDEIEEPVAISIEEEELSADDEMEEKIAAVSASINEIIETVVANNAVKEKFLPESNDKPSAELFKSDEPLKIKNSDIVNEPNLTIEDLNTNQEIEAVSHGFVLTSQLSPFPTTPSITVQEAPVIQTDQDHIDSLRTPLKEHSEADPVFILSPPHTRSRTKKPRIESNLAAKPSTARKEKRIKPPVFEPITPEPQFIFSPPTTRTRSQRKRKIASSATDVARSPKTSRLQSPTPSTSKTPNKTPTRSSRRLTAKRTASKTVAEGSKPGSPVSRSSRSLSKDNPNLVEEQQTVTKTPSRRHKSNDATRTKSTTIEQSPVKNNLNPVTPLPSTSTKALRSSTRTVPTPALRSSSRIKEFATASTSRRTRAGSVDIQPTVTNTSSRRKRRGKAVDDEPEQLPIATRTASRLKKNSDDDVVVTRPRSKTSGTSKSVDVVSHQNDVVVENEMSSQELESDDHSSIFPRRTRGSKKGWCPSNDKVRLLDFTPTKTTEEESFKPTISTRSGRTFFPITSRRKAKVYLWNKKT